jgi:hypothetical protein
MTPSQGKSGQVDHNVFDSRKSSTFKSIPNATWKIQYGDGSTASGDCGTDVVNIGGLKVREQTIECAKKTSAQFQQMPGDGLVGLAFGKINTVSKGGEPVPQKTIVENSMCNF